MFHKILVAIDRSASSQKVLDTAIGLAKSMDASLMLLHILSNEEEDYPQMPSLPTMEYYPIDNVIFESYQKQVRAYEEQSLNLLRSYADQAMAVGVSTEFTQNRGNAGRTICKMAQSWGADLIIMGRRGRSGLNELLLGSVSNYVLHHAPCSVFTVQRTEKDRLAPAQVAQAAMMS
jgi:nucleotide-binding universal stress UspA family protein